MTLLGRVCLANAKGLPIRGHESEVGLAIGRNFARVVSVMQSVSLVELIPFSAFCFEVYRSLVRMTWPPTRGLNKN
jgi:hypothetical protein